MWQVVTAVGVVVSVRVRSLACVGPGVGVVLGGGGADGGGDGAEALGGSVPGVGPGDG